MVGVHGGAWVGCWEVLDWVVGLEGDGGQGAGYGAGRLALLQRPAYARG